MIFTAIVTVRANCKMLKKCALSSNESTETQRWELLIIVIKESDGRLDVH